MRSDMAKVIVERPRFGSRMHGKTKGYRRKIAHIMEEGCSATEGMKRRHDGHRKSLNEHLGPLRRYLVSQVGRPWNLVFSEICEHINRDSAVQDHVRDHVDDFVAKQVMMIDGVPCSAEAGLYYAKPLSQLPYYRRHLYVCPRTGLLKRIRSEKQARKTKTPTMTPPVVKISSTQICKVLAGVWHLVTVQRLPELNQKCEAIDILLGISATILAPTTARENYGAAVFAVDKRRLSEREIRQMPIPAEWRCVR